MFIALFILLQKSHGLDQSIYPVIGQKIPEKSPEIVFMGSFGKIEAVCIFEYGLRKFFYRFLSVFWKKLFLRKILP